MRIEIEGDRIDQIRQAVRQNAEAAVETVALLVLSDSVVRIQTGSKTGRIYRRKGGRNHQASAPNESPATDLGALAASGSAEKTGPLEQEVGFSAEQAEILENGSAGGKIAARPFLAPALEAAAEKFDSILAAAVNAAVGN